MTRRRTVVSVLLAALAGGLLPAGEAMATHPADAGSVSEAAGALPEVVSSGMPAAKETGGESRAAHAVAVLRRGSRGRAVRTLQRRLRVPVDGVFGPQTERAVRRFQRRRRLAVDGVVGPATARALRMRLPAAPRRGRRPRGRLSSSQLLRRIAMCESGGNPRAVSPDGRYRGMYQFDMATWRAMGGRGDPARASASEQTRRARRLLRLRGTAPWPNCA